MKPPDCLLLPLIGGATGDLVKEMNRGACYRSICCPPDVASDCRGWAAYDGFVG
ncbi:hypothetical protein ACLOJK_004885 [Asimina triloba]